MMEAGLLLIIIFNLQNINKFKSELQKIDLFLVIPVSLWSDSWNNSSAIY